MILLNRRVAETSGNHQSISIEGKTIPRIKLKY